jgi:haloalkane dehalogenase
MGQDWGGPTGLSVGVDRADRIGGVVLGNTWFWPATPFFRSFSMLATSWPGRYLIVQHNQFVKGFVPRGTSRTLTAAELRHYAEAQPTPAAPVGVATFPREIRASPLLDRLQHSVPERLGAKPALIVWGLKDWGFREPDRQRVRHAFSDHQYLELPNAAHYIQEDAPNEIAEAITQQFG